MSNNRCMAIHGHVENGVIVLEDGAVLPEGTPVVVARASDSDLQRRDKTRIEFPLVPSKQAGQINLTAERVADLLSEDDAAS